MIKQFFSKEFLLFLLTGGTAATVNYISRIFYSLWMSFSTAVILAYIMGMLTTFLLARILVFRNSTQNLKRMLLFFLVVNIVTASQTWLISMGMANYVLPHAGFSQYNYEISHAVGLAIPVFTSYIGHKYWSFKSS